MLKRPARAFVHPARINTRWLDGEGLRRAGMRWGRLAFAEEQRHRSGFLWLPVVFGLGILAYFSAQDEPELWAAPLLAAIALPFAIIGRGFGRMIAYAVMFVALGFAAASLRTYSMSEGGTLEGERITTITGFVETVETLQRRQRITIRPHHIESLPTNQKMPFRLRIGIPARQDVKPGQFIRLRARVQEPAEAAMPGGYDFRRDAFFRGFGGVGYAFGAISIEAPPHTATLDLRINAQIDIWRNALTARIAESIGGEAGALSAALVTGKRGTIAEETNDALRASGLYHIVSISGLHMVLAAGVFFWLVRAMLAAIPSIALRLPIKKIAALIAMGGATFYCVFSGSEVATERSLIMTLVMLGAILFDRPALAMRNVALSALIVLTREPEALLGPSFQMSYAAVACLIAGNQIWQDWQNRPISPKKPLIWDKQDDLLIPTPTYRQHERKQPKSLLIKILIAFCGILATTLVASLATAPFSAFHFHRLNPFGVLGNALAIPLVSLIVMPAAVAGTLLLPFGLDGFIWQVMGEGMRGVLLVADRVAALDQSSLPTAMAEPITFAILVMALLIFVICRSPLRWGMLPMLLLAFILYQKTTLPDVLVDPAGKMVLIKGEGGQYRLLAAGSIQSFTLAQWLPALGDGRAPVDRTLKEATHCDKAGCIGRLADGRSVALSTKPDALREDCQMADIIITPLLVAAPCREKKHVLDQAHLSQFGATMVMTRNPADWRLKTSLSPHNKRPWRREVALPQAPASTPSKPTRDVQTRYSATEPGDDPGLMPDQ